MKPCAAAFLVRFLFNKVENGSSVQARTRGNNTNTADRKNILSSTLFASVVAIATILAFLYLYNIIKWGDYPDFGFVFRTATGIEVVAMVSDHGREAGMQVGDRILRVNGEPFSTIQEFRAAMNRGLGEENTYLLERGGKEIRVHLTNTPLGLKGSFTRSGFLYLAGLCYALIGTVSFLMKPHRRTTWVFLLFAVTFGLFMAFGYKAGTMVPFWLETFHTLVYTFAPATLIHLGLGFPEESLILKRYPYSQVAPYLVSLFLFVWIRSLTPAITDAPRLWRIAAAAYMAAAVFFFLGSCIRRWLTSESVIAKLRAKVILIGFAFTASIPLVDFLMSTFFKVYISPSPNFYVPMFVVLPLSIGYAIIKHDLFDIDAVIKRTYGYILTTAGIAGTYGLFVLISDLAFGNLEIAQSPVFPLIFVMAVVFLFNPVRNRVQKFVDRVFYRLEYDYQETVQRISETMRSFLKLDDILKAMLDIALGAMFIDAGRVALLNRERAVYECLAIAGKREPGRGWAEAATPMEADGSVIPPARGKRDDGEMVQTKDAQTGRQGPGRGALLDVKIAADAPLIQNLALKKKGVTVYDIEDDPLYEQDKEACAKVFEDLEATLIVPLIYEDRLTGLISLGEKKSGKFYRRDDVNLLTILANQGAVAIENAKLLEEVIEKERMEEELAIARDLQVSMLPTACPNIEGFEIVAASIPAREVGGDFFDFIDMGDGRLGLVIGDVTGKSVSGALVMSASRSVFRMLSEECLSVGEIMTRANRRLKKDVKSGMFVALLYAVLDERDRSLSLCSAGQTQPVHLVARTGDARLLETVGDTFPLGILAEADYRETRLDLETGDKVVFYTDGIVEAMNEREEIFGFDRLLDLVKEAGSMSSESLLKEILCRVKEFAGSAPQHDDLTVIALGAATGR